MIASGPYHERATMMDRTVREHIAALQRRLTLLTELIQQEDDAQKRSQMEAEQRAVESAITLFRSALEVERRISVQVGASRH